MYKIDAQSNKILKLKEKSFGELGFKEREHLQEWIAKEPTALGEELLIIQKEFSGFSDTQERLDLLALDKQGSLVIIENKLDDSGRDVTWQAQKYASYCSNLSKEHIKNIFQDYLDKYQPGVKAEDALSEFFDDADYEDLDLNKGVAQRIILIAAQFRKEVTSTVMWLLNFKLRIQCFRATPYSMGNELFLNIEQIIPTKDAEEYMIGMAEKARDDIDSQTELKHRHVVRREFWAKLLQEMNKKSSLFQNISPSKNHWIGAGSGVRGVALNFVITKSYCRAELYIDRGDREESKYVYDELLALREEIEGDFGGELVWQRLDEKRASRIKSEMAGNIFDKDQWQAMITSMVDSMSRLDKALQGPLKIIGPRVKAFTPIDLPQQTE